MNNFADHKTLGLYISTSIMADDHHLLFLKYPLSNADLPSDLYIRIHGILLCKSMSIKCLVQTGGAFIEAENVQHTICNVQYSKISEHIGNVL